MSQNTFNAVEGVELRSPSGLALDTRGGAARLYVADFSNHRILGWADARTFANGAKADLVLGQPNLRQASPLGIGNRGFNGPTTVAVDPLSGDVYVSDTANNRVLRFVDPFANVDRVEPDKVYGQSDFNTNTANNGGLSRRSLRGPTGLAFDRVGNLWICDSGNHRVLRYPASTLDAEQPEADLVLGQTDFTKGGANASAGSVSASGFNSPIGAAVHPDGSVYVADTQNVRILVFQPQFVNGAAAVRVIGQENFTTRVLPANISASYMRGPNSVFITSAGDMLVAVQQENRVLIFNKIASTGPLPPADRALGQLLLTSDFPNSGTAPKAGPNGLNGPGDVVADLDGNIYVADSLNNRVLAYSPGSAQASRVLGQADFSSNTPNRVGGASLGPARDVVVDYSDENFPVYVADSENNRVLFWRSSLSYRSGDFADGVIGQPDFSSAAANPDTGQGQSPTATSLFAPQGLGLSPNGDLWVADTGNNRVLRFPKPIDQQDRVRADVVLGQAGFLSDISAAVTARSLSVPRDVAVGAFGQIYVSDTGNNRILEYAPDPTNGVGAIRVFGQNSFDRGTAPAATSAQSLSSPTGLHVDERELLYVADSGANRVLVFPLSPDNPATAVSATTVIGQTGFDANGSAVGQGSLNGPLAVSTSPDGEVVVADTGNNRVLVFPSLLFLPTSGGQASQVIGQGGSFTGRSVNYNASAGTATPQALFAPNGLFSDRNGTLYVADTGNNRVLHFLMPTAVVSAATFEAAAGVAPGALVSVFGVNMTSETVAASTVPLPTELGGRYVEVSEQYRAPLLFVSPGQFNVQLPVEASSAAGIQTISVRRADTRELLAGGPLAVAPANPGIFTASQDGKGQALAINQNGSINGPSAPAERGSVVTFFGTGQGPTNPVVANGQPAPSGPLANTVAQPTTSQQQCLRTGFVCAFVGSKIAAVQYSGLAPGFVGLWQVNVQIPSGDDVILGDQVAVRFTLGSRLSNEVTIAIR
ncbi:MAG: hypothetical protein KDC27_00785 [Acidobacteria bacterium]|nr:hypothetical protein [Acidobacteriota bacterium]